MKRLRRAFALVAFALTCTTAALALEVPPPPVFVSDGWVRWLPANLPAAGYATIRNIRPKPMRLVAADSPDYGSVMLHRSISRNGRDTMQMVDALIIPAHSTVKLSPGGYHLMLMDAKHPIKPGDTVRVSLHFSDGETLQATWPVRPANTQ